MSCPLCSKTDNIILKSAFWTLLLNDNQATLGRVYFALNRHETDLTNLTSQEQVDLWKGLSAAKNALDSLFKPDHFNFLFHMNLVQHVHGHLYPRYQTPRRFAGLGFSDERYGAHYNPAQERSIPMEAGASLIEAIRGAHGASGPGAVLSPGIDAGVRS